MAGNKSLGNMRFPVGGGGSSFPQVNPLQAMIANQSALGRMGMQQQMAGAVMPQGTPAPVATSYEPAGTGIKTIIPSLPAAQYQAGEKALGGATEDYVKQGAGAADRALAELKNTLGSYKNVLGERIQNGGQPFGFGESLLGEQTLKHGSLRNLTQQGTMTPQYRIAQDAYGGAVGQMFVQGNKNPNYAGTLGVDATPSLWASGPDEVRSLVKASALTPLATKWALQHGVVTANDMINGKLNLSQDEVISKSVRSGWNPNSPEVESQVDDIMSQGATHPKYANIKIPGLDKIDQSSNQQGNGIDINQEMKMAREAISKGAPADQVFANFKQRTGQDFENPRISNGRQ